MFIVTARIPRRRLIIALSSLLCCALVVLAALALTVGQRSVTAAAEVSDIKTNEDRVAHLNSLGWQVQADPIATEELLIPERFDDSYASYLALQSAQGFDLTKYTGKRVKRYSYRLTNYPESQTPVLADLLIYKNRIVGGQLQAEDGSFLLTLTGEQPPQTEKTAG